MRCACTETITTGSTARGWSRSGARGSPLSRDPTSLGHYSDISPSPTSVRRKRHRADHCVALQVLVHGFDVFHFSIGQFDGFSGCFRELEGARRENSDNRQKKCHELSTLGESARRIRPRLADAPRVHCIHTGSCLHTHTQPWNPTRLVSERRRRDRSGDVPHSLMELRRRTRIARIARIAPRDTASTQHPMRAISRPSLPTPSER